MAHAAPGPVKRGGRFIVVIPALALCGVMPVAASFEVQRLKTEATNRCAVHLNASRFSEIIPEYWIPSPLSRPRQPSDMDSQS